MKHDETSKHWIKYKIMLVFDENWLIHVFEYVSFHPGIA